MSDKRNSPSPRPHLPNKQASGRSTSLISHQVGALPLFNRIIDRLNLGTFLDAYLSAPSRGARPKIAIADTILVLVRNVLSSREPMYGVGEWAALQAADLLGLEETQVLWLNDDRVGRALDRVFESDHASMAISIVAHALSEFDVSLDQLHNDSTTISFFGKYEDARPGAEKKGRPTLGITRGHSKDHRPDLKQLLYILTISQDGAIPVHFRACDGNTTDDTTHQASWEILRELNDGDPSFLYVADCKLATEENMSYIHTHGGRFVTVLPRTRSEVTAFRSLLQEHRVELSDEIYRVGDPDSADANVYRLAEHSSTTREGYALYWYHSSDRQEHERAGRSKRLDRANKELYELRDRLSSPRTRLRSTSKIQVEVDKILQKHDVEELLRVEVVVYEHETYRQTTPGRPGPNTSYSREVRDLFDIHFEIDEVAIAAESLTDGFFPLVTNDPKLEPGAALQAYKGQPRVEKRFSQLKSDFEIAPVFLKSVSRIEGLFCVYFIAMLVQALFERELRQQMSAADVDSLPIYPEGRPCRRPTAQRIVDIFGNIQRHVINPGTDQEVRLLTELSEPQQAVLKTLGMTPGDLE